MHFKRYYFFILSFTLHLVAAMLLLNLTLIAKKHEIASQVNITPVQLFSVTTLNPARSVSNNKQQPVKMVRKFISNNHPINTIKQTNTADKSNLLALIHQAIAQKEIYPTLAETNNETGKVTLSFYLSPNGSIDDLQVAQSSGSSLLDHAAIVAINAITPFDPAKKYLRDKTQFQVDVEFE
jgi:TonB family protein